MAIKVEPTPAFFNQIRGLRVRHKAMNQDADEFIPTRRSLLARLKDWGDQEGWQTFFDTYWKLIYRVATRAGLSETEAQDVVQETLVSVARQMPHFKYDPEVGSFKSWLCQITRRRISDHLRKEYRRPPVQQVSADETSSTAILDRIADPADPRLDSLWEEEWKRHSFEAALRRVKDQVEPKHFQIFDCYVRKEWPIKDIVAAFQVSPGSVYVIKHRLTAMLAKELQSLDPTSPEK